MPTTIKNLYKTPGIFTCRHPAHKQFGHEVSPYHVFCVKKCHPEGCVEFLWRCRTFEKGRPCPRGFKHVGRGCFSCKQYHETKLCYMAEASLDDAALADFMDRLREYQGWLESMNGKSVEFVGVVEAVRPHLMMHLESRKSAVTMDGFYMSFAKGFIGKELFDDRLYLKISGSQLERHRPTAGDKLELTAYFTASRGRIVLRQPRRIEITRNGGREIINVSRALVGRATGKVIAGPIEYCRDCPYCSLVDIDDQSRNKASFYRRFYCLRGVSDSENCPVRLGRNCPGSFQDSGHETVRAEERQRAKRRF